MARTRGKVASFNPTYFSSFEIFTRNQWGDKVREVLAINEILTACWYSVGASWMGSSFPNGLFGVSENGKTGCSFFSRIQLNVTV